MLLAGSPTTPTSPARILCSTPSSSMRAAWRAPSSISPACSQCMTPLSPRHSPPRTVRTSRCPCTPIVLSFSGTAASRGARCGRVARRSRRREGWAAGADGLRPRHGRLAPSPPRQRPRDTRPDVLRLIVRAPTDANAQAARSRRLLSNSSRVISPRAYRSPRTSNAASPKRGRRVTRRHPFRSVILIIATAWLSLNACSFVSLLQVQT